MLRRNWPQKPPVGTPPAVRDTSLREASASLWLLKRGLWPPFDAAADRLAAAIRPPGRPANMGRPCPSAGRVGEWSLGTQPAALDSRPTHRARVLAGGVASDQQQVIDYHSTTNTGGWACSSDTGGNNEIDFLAAGNTQATTGQSSPDAADGNLHVFGAAWTATGTGGVLFYRDGVPWGTGSTGTARRPPTAARGASPRIGRLGPLLQGADRLGRGVEPRAHARRGGGAARTGSNPNAIARLFDPPRVQAAIPAAGPGDLLGHAVGDPSRPLRRHPAVRARLRPRLDARLAGLTDPGRHRADRTAKSSQSVRPRRRRKPSP